MRYWLDTEFIEKPCTIDLLSIGMVAEDGQELYAVNKYANLSAANEWVLENVVPHLGGPKVSPTIIADRIRTFIGDDPKPEFWGYYADYDWVVFCWLFGSMVDLPKGWPMYCRDIKQLCDHYGNPKLPEQTSAEHNALEDARWNRKAHEFLTMGYA